jgi:tryptophanyl-tRNA synthetase
MRPTGRLHIGHYFGALQNWVRLQSDPSYDCFYFVADWHALTSDYADTSAVAENTLQIAIDFLASGLDPLKSVIFQQSQIIEHAELHLVLSMITPLGWLERIPTYKEALDNIQNKDLHTYGFLGYPTLQTADIVMYSDPGKPLFVPVGEDQVSHVEFSRELVRRFNTFYGLSISESLFAPENSETLRAVLSHVELPVPLDPEVDPCDYRTQLHRRISEIGYQNFVDKLLGVKIKSATAHRELDDLQNEFAETGSTKTTEFFNWQEQLTEPSALLTPTPRIPGLDGRKMSKSYGNAITLSESDVDIRSKTKVMVTDPARKRRTDPGNPDICPVYDWHKLFSTPERDPGRLEWVQIGCRSAGIGCIECKSSMADNLIKWIDPVRASRLEHEQHPRRVLEILDAGSAKARHAAQQTMSRVREAVLGWSRKHRNLSS